MKKYIIVAVVLVIIFIIIKKMGKKKPMESDKTINEVVAAVNSGTISGENVGQQDLMTQITLALKSVIDEFGVDTARTVEKIYRLETNHFKSGGFLGGFSPGMEKHKDTFPFGWTSQQDFWNSINFIPDFHTLREGKGVEGKGGAIKTFLKFPNVQIPMKGLAIYTKKYSPERWYSKDPTQQAIYRNKLNSIKSKIVDKLWNG